MKKDTKKKLQKINELEESIWDSSVYFINTKVRALLEYAQEQVIAELEELYFKEEGKLTRTDIYRRMKLEAIFGELGNKLNKEVTERLDEVAKSTNLGQKEIIGTVDWHFFTDNEVKSLVNRDFQGTDFSKRIWNNTEELAERVKKDITRIVVNGDSPNKITEAIAKDFKVSYSKAQRLVRTETSRVFEASALKGYEQAGYSELAIEVMDIGPYPCKECEDNAYDKNHKHKKYTFANLPTIPEHPNCRCRAVPYEFVD